MFTNGVMKITGINPVSEETKEKMRLAHLGKKRGKYKQASSS